MWGTTSLGEQCRLWQQLQLEASVLEEAGHVSEREGRIDPDSPPRLVVLVVQLSPHAVRKVLGEVVHEVESVGWWLVEQKVDWLCAHTCKEVRGFVCKEAVAEHMPVYLAWRASSSVSFLR